MSIDNVLTRLEKVKQTTKDSYVACCPAHEDKTPSLSIKELLDGRVLIHCFAGCDTHSVLGAIGLELHDLFPKCLGDFKKTSRPFPAVDVLRAVGFESLVVANTGTKMLNGEPLTQEDRERLSLSVGRIQAAINAAGLSNGRY